MVANENSPHWILPIKIFFFDALRLFNVKFFSFRFLDNTIVNGIRFNKYAFLGFQVLASYWLIYEMNMANQMQEFWKPTLVDQSFYSKTSRFSTFLFTILGLTVVSLTTKALWLVKNQNHFWLAKSSSKHKQSFEFCQPRRKIFQLVSHLDFFSNGHRKIRVCLFFARDLWTMDKYQVD